VKPGQLKKLQPRHEEFAILVADPTDKRGMAEKAEACGFSGENAWRLAQRPEIAEMIRRYTAENIETLRSKIPQVIEMVGSMALDGDLKAADLFLEAAGIIGRGANVNVVTNVTQKDDDFADRLRTLRERALSGE